MAVKRIIPKRLEKVGVAGETESMSPAYLENLIRKRIWVGTEDPLNTPDYVLEGNIWRNTATNPDTWNILMNGAWVNMLASTSEHGLMKSTDRSLLNTATYFPTSNALVKYDTNRDLNAKSFNSTSSRRFKTNISKINQATEIIKELEGVSFNWKSDGVRDIGLIAEDVFDVVPEVVKLENGIIEGIAYDHLVSVLIQGFKEQQNQIDKILNHLGLDNE